MRKIIITIKDEKTNENISATTTVNDLNELYKRHGINGIVPILISLNQEINDKIGENVEIILPNDLTILPDNKKW